MSSAKGWVVVSVAALTAAAACGGRASQHLVS